MMKNRKAIVGVVVVFVLGILCGGLATHLHYNYRIESIISGRGHSREEMIIKRLERKLDLDERQESQIRAIVHETHSELRGLRNQLRPQTEAIIEQSQAKISAILTPEQRKRYEQMIAEHRERMKRRMNAE